MASDRREIRYSPRWIAETDAHVIETAMARVVLACALKHHTRRGERDPITTVHSRVTQFSHSTRILGFIEEFLA